MEIILKAVPYWLMHTSSLKKTGYLIQTTRIETSVLLCLHGNSKPSESA